MDIIFIVNERQAVVHGELDHLSGEPTAQIVSTAELTQQILSSTRTEKIGQHETSSSILGAQKNYLGGQVVRVDETFPYLLSTCRTRPF